MERTIDKLGSCVDDADFDGSGDSFERLFEDHVRSVLRYARSRVGHETAEDIVAETFLQAWAARTRFNHVRGTAAAWLLGIATRVIARHRDAEQRWLRSRASAISLQADRSDARALSAEAVAIDRESSSHVMQALSRMPVKFRDALLLHELAGLSYEDVSLALNVPVGTVRSRISRAREQLERSSS